MLPRFQVEAGRDLNYKVSYPRASFDRQSIAWDLNYFKYYFLRLAGVPFNEQALEADFGRLTKFLLSAPHEYFLYRDFQSRNVMLRDGNRFFWTTRAAAKARCNMTLLRCSTMARPICRRAAPRTARLLSRVSWRRSSTLKREAFMEHYYAYVYVRICKRWGPTGSEGSMSARRIFCRACPTR